MPISYTAINGLAGSITAILYDRATLAIISSVSLAIFNFEEDDEDLAGNSIFENMNDDLIKDYYGHRKKINFTLANGSGLSDTNLANIISFVTMINRINVEGKTIGMSIRYRDSAIIPDVIYVGNFKLAEISKKANAGQLIDFEFTSKQKGILSFMIPEYINYIALENGKHIKLEGFTESKLITQTYITS